MSAATLEAALRSLGLVCTVEAHDRLAVIVADNPAALEDARLRRAAMSLLAGHGFTHLALELTGPPADVIPTVLRGSHAGAIDGAAVHRD
jgi:hypothetical protein